jgi:8-oxo-dGTP diphosphatase
MNSYSCILIENSNGNFLLQLKDSTYKLYPLHWSILGGKIEENETPLEAIKREMIEEINTELINPKFIESQIINNEKLYLFHEKMDLDIPKIVLTEGEKVEYLSKEQILELKMLPSGKKLFQYYLKKISDY